GNGAFLGGGDAPNLAAVAATTALVAGVMSILMGAVANFPLALDAGVLLGADVAVRRRALRAAAVRAGCPAGALNRGHVLAVDALLTDWHGQGPVPLPGGVAASRACGRLLLGPVLPVHDERQER
ncbi:TilS substrate-binding domain-containing protein, partial [Cellulomonas fimi]|uniref:TilS substrate-binding domain-containing protein n=1 Tax=Cellulomonas fimi TaxID=1708 RepID=UPI00234C25C7